MPYIDQAARSHIEPWLAPLLTHIQESKKHRADYTPGELNYSITKILLATEPMSYTDYNALIGVLESCKLEFYRRAVAAYEDEKIVENGDVF